MKNCYSLLVAFSLCTLSYSQSPSEWLIGLDVETEDLSSLGQITDAGGTQDFTGYTSYKLYAVFGDPSYRLAAIAGINYFNADSYDPNHPDNPTPGIDYQNEQHDLIIGSTGGSFYNNSFGSSAGGLNADLLPIPDFESLQYDTYLTIGEASFIGSSQVSALSTLPSGTFFNEWGATNGAGELNGQDVVIFTFPDNAIAAPDADGRVYLGQLTTDGEPYWELNLTGQKGIDPTTGGPIPVESWAINNVDNFVGDVNGGPLHECGCSVGLIYPAPSDCDQFSLACLFCGDPTACNYVEGADPEDTEICLYGEIGCTLLQACNYDPNASCSDNSLCDFETCAGCTDQAACNYNPGATLNMGCDYSCFGCMDIDALNYDETATLDDGSCVFLSCGNSEPTEVITFCYGNANDLNYTFQALPGEQITLSITEGGIELNSDELRIYDGEDNGGTLLFQNSTSSLAGTYATSTSGYLYLELESNNTVSCGTNSFNPTTLELYCSEVLGCSEPEALNYNPLTTFDDGSCVVTSCGSTVPTQSEVICYANNETNAYLYTALADQQVTLQIVSGDVVNPGDTLTIYDGIDNTGEQLFTSHQTNLSNTYVSSTTGNLYMELVSNGALSCANSASLFDPLEINLYCAMVFGCSDSAACNFDASATTDDGSCCYDQCYELQFEEGSFPQETSWSIVSFENEEIASGNVFESQIVCLPDGCYTFNMIDFFGDGWNGASYALIDGTGNILFSGGLDNASIGDTTSSGSDYWNINSTECPIGCIDSNACNFNPNAEFTDNSCVYPGCMDSAACNYDPVAICSSGDCLYESVISGYVFNDLNQNGSYQQNNFDEYGLNFFEVTIEELGLTAFSNGDGFYEFFNVPSGATYTVSIVNLGESWETTSASSVTITTEACAVSDVNLGVAAVGTDPVHIAGPCCIFFQNIHCDLGFNPGLWVNNLGSTALNGTITVAYDELFDAEPFGSPAVDPTGIEPGLITWDISNHQGGQNLLYQAHLGGPGVDVIGQTFPIEITLNLLNDGGETYYENTWVLEPMVVCAYDPNDKYAENEGYTEEHFILPDETIEYRVRFQNTGNFQAFNVRVDDQLDTEHLDVGSFQPIVASHSMMACIDQDGFIEFHFDNINLPDSASDEPGSQGYLVYQIKLKDDVQPGDVINNTAEIYFDSNPAVITNTTWHTIYECPIEPAVADADVTACAGSPFSLEVTEPYMQTYSWLFEGEEIGTDALLDYTLDEAGNYQFEVTMTNPICSTFRMLDVEVSSLPEVSLFAMNNVLEIFNDTGIELVAYQWYLNGELIDGATSSDYAPTAEGIYTVEVTTASGCSNLSSELDFNINVQELDGLSLSIFPNPAAEQLYVDWAGEGKLQIQLFDQSGKLVRLVQQFDTKQPIDVSDLAKGSYVIRINDQVSLPFVKM